MRTIRSIGHFIGFAILAAFLATCTDCKTKKTNVPAPPESDIVILYENDVHCAVEGYAKLVTLRKKQEESTPYVTTVSCGDFIQGGLIGAVSTGGYIIEIMNKVGYDVITLGNHEFDFGTSRMLELMGQIDAKVVNANFFDLRTNQPVFPAYEILTYGQTKIAFIGLTTTSAISQNPNKFYDDNGEVIYNLSKENFYEVAQFNIDKAKEEGADYVVILSHLGDEDIEDNPSSCSLIAQTTGIDVVLDAHAHHYLPDTLIYDKEGQAVLMSSTGSQFQSLGILTLSTEGVFRTRLEPLKGVMPDAETQTLVDSINALVEATGNKVIGYSEINLPLYDKNGKRFLRSQEGGLGNYCADAFRIVLDTDVAILNAGGIRDSISAGNITYNSMKKVMPYSNTGCIAIMTGQQIVDALEFSVKNLPSKFSEFSQVSGLTFQVDTSVIPPVLLDKNKQFAGVCEGKRRVYNVKVLDKTTGSYIPIDLKEEYGVASTSYLFVEKGGQGILGQAKVVEKDILLDAEILSTYIHQHLNGVISKQYATSEGRILID